MTPRKIDALLFVAAKRKKREQRALLALHALAAQGDPKAIKTQLLQAEE